MHLAALQPECAAPHQVVIVPESAETMASSARSRLPSSRGDHLRLHRLVGPACRALPSASRHSSFPSAPSRGTCGPRGARAAAAAPRSVRLAIADQADLDRDSAGRCASGRDRSARRAPGRASDRTRCRGTTCRPSAACRTPPARPATAWCRAARCRRWCRGCRRAPRPCRAAALTIGAPSFSATAPVARRRRKAPWPARIATFLPAFRISAAARRSAVATAGGRPARHTSRRVVRDVAFGRLAVAATAPAPGDRPGR